MRIENLVVSIVLVSVSVFCGCPLFKGEAEEEYWDITDILTPEEALPVLTGRYFKARVKSEKTGNLDDSLHVIYPKEFLVNLPVYLTEEHQDECIFSLVRGNGRSVHRDLRVDVPFHRRI